MGWTLQITNSFPEVSNYTLELNTNVWWCSYGPKNDLWIAASKLNDCEALTTGISLVEMVLTHGSFSWEVFAIIFPPQFLMCLLRCLLMFFLSFPSFILHPAFWFCPWEGVRLLLTYQLQPDYIILLPTAPSTLTHTLFLLNHIHLVSSEYNTLSISVLVCLHECPIFHCSVFSWASEPQ